MVLDFGFLKEEMMAQIDANFDHSFIFCARDDLCCDMFGLSNDALRAAVERDLDTKGFYSGNGGGDTRINVLPFVPTAEHLARFWFDLLAPRVAERSQGQTDLVSVKVWETPNCWAAFGPEATL